MTEIEFEPQTRLVGPEDDDDATGPKFEYYESEKVLGELYRAIDEKRLWSDEVRIQVDRRGPSVWDQVLAYIKKECDRLGGMDWIHALSEARQIRNL